MHSDEELLLTNSSSSSSCEDVWEGEGQDSIRVPSRSIRVPPRRVKRHCKVVGQARNWNRLDNEEAGRRDLEDDLERERRLVSDLDTRLLQMETEKMELIHQFRVAKQMGNCLESHLIFLEEQLAAQLVQSDEDLPGQFQLVHSDQKQMRTATSSESPLIFLEEQLANQLINSDEEPARKLQLDWEANQQDGALRKHERQTLGESKPEQLLKRTDMETQTEPEKEESQHPLTLVEDDMPNKIILDQKGCGEKHVFGFATKQIWFAGLQTIFQELLVHLIV